jgi:dihydroorotase
MKIILKNLKLIHPDIKNSGNTDILITDGVVSKVGKLNKEDIKDAEEFDFPGCYAAPGFLDMHVHLREPGREDEETVVTGCNCAAAGGFTAVACMPNTEPAIDSAEVIMLIKKEAANHLVDVYPVGAATIGRKGELLSPMAELHEAGAVGFSDDGVAIKTSGFVKRALEYSKMFNLPIIEHCEDESLAGGAMNEGINSTMLGLPPIPSVAEDIIVIRDILLAEYTGGRIHIAHMSTKEACEMVRQAKKKGINVTAEVSPHHFSLTDDAVKTYDTNTRMNPPLRTQADVDAMIEGLKDGTIDCIASDHAPHSPEEKEAEYELAPNGILGLETQTALALTELYHKKHLTLEQIVEKLAINPRKILNVPVPAFKEGEKANFTIFNPDMEWTYEVARTYSKSKNSPFDGREFKGKAVAVVNKGKMFTEGKFIEI